jgi:maltose alpha-D-glucosyltransferase/alpha-amylase
LRSFSASRNPEAILLAETNIHPEQIDAYINNGQRMHMLFNFYVNQNLFLSVAKADASALKKAIQKLPSLNENHQWLNFLRHHDELSLKLLKKNESERVFKEFAPKPNMRLYERGIRRRIVPMLNGHRKKLELAYSLLYTLPGAPLLRYGDEIGMGEDLSLHGRTSVRTPMQWSSGKNAGFSSGPEEKLVHPVIKNGKYAFDKVNILSAQRDPGSFLNWVERLITTRKQTPEIGIGKYKIVRSVNSALMIHSCEWGNVKMIFIHNLSKAKVSVPKKVLKIGSHTLFDIFCDSPLKERRHRLIIDGYGYQWLRIEKNRK